MNKITARQTEILRYVAMGETNKRIGSILKISEQTVKNHLSSAFDYLEAKDRTHAVVKAIKAGFITI